MLYEVKFYSSRQFLETNWCTTLEHMIWMVLGMLRQILSPSFVLDKLGSKKLNMSSMMT